MIRKTRSSKKKPKSGKLSGQQRKVNQVVESDKTINMMKEIVYYEQKKLGELNELLDENIKRRDRWERAGMNIEAVDHEISRLKKEIKDLKSKSPLISTIASNIQKPQSYREFNTGKMSLYMKIEGSHGLAIKRMAREWDGYKDDYVTGNGEYFYRSRNRDVIKLKSDKWYKKKSDASKKIGDGDVVVKQFDRYYIYSK